MPPKCSNVSELAGKVREIVAKGEIDAGSAIQVIRATLAVGASWDVVEDVVRELAKGADGVAGTADDLIPQPTLDILCSLLNSGAVRDLVSWAGEWSGAGGKASVLASLVASLLATLKSCFSRKPQ